MANTGDSGVWTVGLYNTGWAKKISLTIFAITLSGVAQFS